MRHSRFTIALVYIASAAFPLATLAQTPDRADRQDKREAPKVRNEVHVHVTEFFDEPRDPQHFRHLRPGVFSNGSTTLTYDGECHWLQRRAALFPEPEDQEEEEKPPDYALPPTSSGTPFRNVAGGGKIQFATSLGIPALDAVSPFDAAGVSFDDVDMGTAPGGFFSTTLAFGDFEMMVFADFISGRFDSSEAIDVIADVGRGPELFTDRFRLTGDLWLIEAGVAPILKRFATDDGVFRVELAVAAGAYFGKLTNLDVERSGSTAESFSLSDENLFGGFAGPTANMSLRLFENVRLGAFAEAYRLFGDLDGWSILGGLEIIIDLADRR